MESGLVTVMVPSYNYAQYLGECVESAVDQADVDVCIVENGSTDGSPALARELAASFDNVRLIEYDDNRGIIASFNRCRDAVIGEFSVLLCADDCLTPGAIDRARAVMRSHPSIGMVYGPAMTFGDLDHVDPSAWSVHPGPPVVHAGVEWVTALCRSAMNPIRAPELMMRTSVNQVVGNFDPRCPHTSDLNMWLRIAAVSDVAFVPGPAQALYRVHDAMHSGNFPFYSASDLEQRWSAFEAFLETVDDSSQRFEWESTVRRRLGSEARYAATRMYVAADVDEPQDQADHLRHFADTVDPTASVHAEGLGWSLRRRLGPERSRWFPGFLPRAAFHRAARLRGERRRERIGLE